MPSFKSDGFIHKCLTIEVEQRQRRWGLPAAGIGKGVSFFYSEQKKKKLLPLSCAGSLTLTYALSVTIF